MGGECICRDGFAGKSCERQRCPQDCSGNGFCFEGRCQCSGDYGGAACANLVHASSRLRVWAPPGSGAPAAPTVRSGGQTSRGSRSAPISASASHAHSAQAAAAEAPRVSPGLLQAAEANKPAKSAASAWAVLRPNGPPEAPPQVKWPSLPGRGQGRVEEGRAQMQTVPVQASNASELVEEESGGAPSTAKWISQAQQQPNLRATVAAAPSGGAGAGSRLVALLGTAQASPAKAQHSLLRSLFRRAAGKQAAAAGGAPERSNQPRAAVAAAASPTWPPLPARHGPHQVTRPLEAAQVAAEQKHSLNLATLLASVTGGVRKAVSLVAD